MCLVPLALAAFLFGCSRPKLPVMLASQIAGADRVMVSDQMRGYRLSFTNENVGELVKAVSLAKRERAYCSCIFGCHVDFFKGTNWLGVIQCQHGLFLTDEGEPAYRDDSGVLNAFYQKWDSDKSARIAWTQDLARNLSGSVELVKLQEWTQEILQQAETNRWNEIPYSHFSDRINTNFHFWEAHVLRGPTGKPESLYFLGHCDLLVGSKDYKTTFNDWAITNFESAEWIQYAYITNIAPGVYLLRGDE